MLNKQNGVTMIQMVVTIIMIILIASFAVLNSRETISETKLAKIYEEVMTVKKSVMEALLLDSNILDSIPDGKLDNLEDYNYLEKYYDEKYSYYLLDFKNQSDILNEDFDVRNIENNYIVCVKESEKIETYLLGGIKMDEDTTCYTDSEILEKYNSIFAGR